MATPPSAKNRAFGRGRLALEMTGETPVQRGHAKWVGRELRKAVSLLPVNRLERVTVSVVGDATMGRLHLASHGMPEPTDVLTYELEHTGKGDVTEGQVVVCAGEALRRSREHSIAVRRELLLYALHGLLHLCGMDDRRAKDFALMHAKEDEILEAIGVGRTFRPAPKERGRGRRR